MSRPQKRLNVAPTSPNRALEDETLPGISKSFDIGQRMRDGHWKISSRKNCAFTSWLFILHLLSMVVFLSGFLLSRTALESKSDCSMYKRAGFDVVSGTSCLEKPRFQKLVLLIVDALRFDFVMHEKKDGEFYLNNLEILDHWVQKDPSKARLWRFRADPPTTTLQRLKALTTGTLPTFIDAGSNFASSIIAEDNLVDKFVLQFGQKMIFTGDDTWQGLFPNALAAGNRTWPYPSFNVWDLDTVDDGVIRHLFPALKGDYGEWDLFVGHFLGVDHVGHRYGPDHPAMKTKLQQMNQVIEKVIQQLPSDSLLVVLGDHGMDPKGDHGGDSDRELDAGLFVYAPSGITQGHDDQILKDILLDLDKQELDGNLGGRNHWMTKSMSNSSWITTPNRHYRTIPQIDLIPTLAYLFGIPIPVENIGTMIPEMVWTGNTVSERLQHLTRATRLNALHMLDYLLEYSLNSRELSDTMVKQMKQPLDEAEGLWKGGANQSNLREAYMNYVRFTRTTLSTLRRMWARFDMYLMVLGIVLTSLVLFTPLLTIASMRFGDLSQILSLADTEMFRSMVSGAGLGLAFVRPITALLKHRLGVDTTFNLPHAVLFGIGFGSVVGFLFEWKRRCRFNPKPTLLEFVAFVTPVIHASTLFSDNFVFREDSFVFALLLVYLIFMTALNSAPNKQAMIPRFIPIFLLATAAGYSTICREEQLPYCAPTFYSSPGSSVSGWGSMTVMTLCLFLLPWMVDWLVGKFTTRLGKGSSWKGVGRVIVKLMFPLLLTLSGLYWWIDWMVESNGTDFKNFSLERWKTSLIRYVWVPTALASIINVFMWPSCEDLELVNQDEEVKQAMQTLGMDSNGKVEILGYTTTVPLTVLTMFCLLFGCLVLFEKPMGSAALTAQFVSCLMMFDIADLWPDKKPHSPPMFLLSLLHLLAHHYFFRTGHQAALATLDWSVAFIGLNQVNYVLSPIMVTLNFLAPFILSGVAAMVMSAWIRWPSQAKWQRQSSWGQTWWDVQTQCAILYMTISFIPTAFTMIGALILRRHLMVWRVFAPRFMLACCATIASDLGILLGLGMIRLALSGQSLLGPLRLAPASAWTGLVERRVQPSSIFWARE